MELNEIQRATQHRAIKRFAEAAGRAGEALGVGNPLNLRSHARKGGKRSAGPDPDPRLLLEELHELAAALIFAMSESARAEWARDVSDYVVSSLHRVWASHRATVIWPPGVKADFLPARALFHAAMRELAGVLKTFPVSAMPTELEQEILIELKGGPKNSSELAKSLVCKDDSAIRRCIRSLVKKGCDIRAVRGRGYCLVAIPQHMALA